MAFLLPGRLNWWRPLGNSRDCPSCDFPGFKYLCLLPPTQAWLKHPVSLPSWSGVSIFSPGCPNLITRLRLRRSRLLPKAHRCFMLQAWMGSGVFSEGCVCNRGELYSRCSREPIMSILGTESKRPGTCTSPFFAVLGFPHTHGSQIRSKPWAG